MSCKAILVMSFSAVNLVAHDKLGPADITYNAASLKMLDKFRVNFAQPCAHCVILIDCHSYRLAHSKCKSGAGHGLGDVDKLTISP